MKENPIKKIILPSMDAEQVANEIGEFIVHSVKRAGLTGGVIGLSGGIDSTTSAALAKRAFDIYNQINSRNHLELVGYILPSRTNNKMDEDDGVKVAELLGIRYEIQNIEPIVQAYNNTNPEALNSVYDKGNMMSRIRANVLSTKAATEKKLVIGTGNKDEDFGIGYYTLFGDGAVHLSPIGGLSKRLVRQMASHLGFAEYFVKREPTAGLEPGQTDFKDLGYGYDVVELVIEAVDQGFDPKSLAKNYQVIKMVKPQLEHSKFSSVDQVVDDLLRRHYHVAKAKAEIIHPPIAPATLNYGGD